MATTADQRDDAPAVTATPEAAAHAQDLMDSEGLDASAAGLRLSVKEGCCEEYSYVMRLSEEPESGDSVFESNDLRLFVDDESLEYVAGSRLAFEDGVRGEGFHVENPNAESECGCGESFST